MKKPTFNEVYEALKEVQARLEKRKGTSDVYAEMTGAMHIWLAAVLSGEEWEVKHVLEAIEEFK